ncbi:MAG: DNA repair protein RecO [Bacteroidota bacterium]
MICKTEAIVLRTLKHQESNVISTLYTKEFGLRSFIIKGYRSTRSRRKHSYFQPLSIIDIVFVDQANRDLQKISESKAAIILEDIQTHPVKLSLGLALLEIFTDTVKEVEPNLPMYDCLYTTITGIDQAPNRLIHLFIWFLLHHTKHLGFFPHDKSGSASFVNFDIPKGVFHAVPNDGNPIANLLRRFVYCTADLLPDPHSCQQLIFDSNTKRHLIKTLFDYYRVHIHGFRYPQTMKVFAEVFGE